MKNCTSTLLEELLEEIQKKYPQLYTGLLGSNNKKLEQDIVVYAEKILNYYVNYMGKEKLKTSAVDYFAKVSFDFMRYQTKFTKTKKYIDQTSDILERELYSNQEKMNGYYLNGLFLSYALWKNHTKIYQFFIEKFLELSRQKTKFIEVGTGHGLMGLTSLEYLKNSNYTGIDLSEGSLKYANGLFCSANISPDRFQLRQGNVLIMNSITKENFNMGICCEVLEHVENPDKILNFFRRALGYNGRLFITTVANIAAEDHIYLFRNPDEIKKLIYDQGFEVENELILPLSSYKTRDYIPMNYAATLKLLT